MIQTIQSSPAPARRRGFTIIELLVTIAIILVLMAILSVALTEAKKHAHQSANAADIGAISTALDAYFQNMNAYPDSTNRTFAAASGAGAVPSPFASPMTLDSGASVLAEGLLGYLPYAFDGAGSDSSNNSTVATSDTAYGFRTRTGGFGKVYGPYMPPKLYSTNTPLGQANYTIDAATGNEYFIDSYGHKILYFRSFLVGNPSTSTITGVTTVFGSGTTTSALFNTDDNFNITGTPNETSGFYNLLGATGNVAGGTVVGHTSYLLVSPDEYGVYFDNNNVVNSQ